MKRWAVIRGCLALGIAFATSSVAQPLQPVEPLKPAEPFKKPEPFQPIEPFKPIEPLKPVEPLRPPPGKPDPETAQYCKGENARKCTPCVKECRRIYAKCGPGFECDEHGIPMEVTYRGNLKQCAWECTKKNIPTPSGVWGDASRDSYDQGQLYYHQEGGSIGPYTPRENKPVCLCNPRK